MIPYKTLRLPALALLLWATNAHPADFNMGPPPENSGQYLVQIAGCADCHSLDEDRYLAGGLKFEIPPFGTVYTPNITPDPVNGIGRWTFEDFKGALRDGVNPQGRHYYPVFPYRSYTKISDEDLRKMWEYLRGVVPLPIPNRKAKMLMPRIGVWGWNQLFVGKYWGSKETGVKRGYGEFQPVPDQSADWNRGAYLAEALAHCTECHTWRYPLANGLDVNYWMSGGDIDGAHAPNITSDKKTGKGSWGEGDWDHFLKTGQKKNGEWIQNKEMQEVVQNTAVLSDGDRHALIVYLRALKPVRRGENAQ